MIPTRTLRLLVASLALALPAVVPGQAMPAATVARADVDPQNEAIRERIDRLRYELQHDQRDPAVQGERIVLGDTVARYYESQQFQAKWGDPARLDLLLASLFELLNDGLEPNDYHVEALQSYRRRSIRSRIASVIGSTVATAGLATDAAGAGWPTTADGSPSARPTTIEYRARVGINTVSLKRVRHGPPRGPAAPGCQRAILAIRS